MILKKISNVKYKDAITAVLVMIVFTTLIITNLNDPKPISRDSEIISPSISDDSKATLYYKKTIVYLDIAVSESKQEKGFMQRENIESDEGMLFYFQSSESRVFWMQNTPSSLDIIFLDEHFKVVNLYKNTKPNQTSELYPSIKPCKYVIELKAGWIDSMNLTLNEYLTISYDQPR